MLQATIQFDTRRVRYGGGKSLWTITKEFNDVRHLDNFITYIHKKKNYLLDEVWYTGGYPFNEGDTYYTIEKAMAEDDTIHYVVIESVWDDVSEELYDQDKFKFYTYKREAAEEYANDLQTGRIKIYR